MAIIYNQRNATRNQSTVDYTQEIIFLSENDSRSAVFKNNTSSNLDLEQGIMVLRDVSTGYVVPAVAGDTLQDIIGIVRFDGVTTLAAEETANIDYAFNGQIDSGLIVFPATVDLNTTVGNKKLVDVLTEKGFNPRPVTDNSNFDN